MNTNEYDSDSISPEDEGAGLDKYKRLRDDVYAQLMMVQHYLFFCDRIESFPFRLFLPLPQDWFFWRVTRNALAEAAFITLYRVTLDNDAPLNRLHNGVTQEVKKNPVAAKVIFARLNGIKKSLEAEKDSLHQIRISLIAHYSELSPESAKLPGQHLDVSRLWILLDKSWALFDILCLDKRRPHWYDGYLDDHTRAFRPTTRIDIDAILDRIEEENITRLKEPEWNSSWDRSNLSGEDLAILNECRKKFGLSEV